MENKQETPIVKATMRRRGISMETDREQFALALKTWRLRQNITQRQLAKQWGCSRYTIIRAESALSISWEMAYRLFAMLAYELEKEKKGGVA